MKGALKELMGYIDAQEIEYLTENGHLLYGDIEPDLKDIVLIKAHNPELKELDAVRVHALWSEFSTHFYCAGYMDVTKGDLKEFREEIVLADRYKPQYYSSDFYEWKYKLKTCPFCGGAAKIQWEEIKPAGRSEAYTHYNISCDDEGCVSKVSFWASRSDVIGKWNTRVESCGEKGKNK